MFDWLFVLIYAAIAVLFIAFAVMVMLPKYRKVILGNVDEENYDVQKMGKFRCIILVVQAILLSAVAVLEYLSVSKIFTLANYELYKLIVIIIVIVLYVFGSMMCTKGTWFRKR